MKTGSVGKHGRSYSFTFALRISPEFAALLSQEFEDLYTGQYRSVVGSAYRELKAFVCWLLDRRTRHSQVIAHIISALLDSLRAGTGPSFSEDLYLQLCEHYAQRFREHQPGTRHGDLRFRLRVLRSVLRKLSGLGSLPTISRGLASPATYQGATRSHPPLAALTRSGVVAWENSGELNTAIEAVLRDAGVPFKRLTLDQRLQALMSLNQVRLGRLRHLLEQELLVERDIFDEGQRLMSRPGLPSDEEIRAGLAHPGNKTFTRHRWFWKHMNGDVETGMGIVLRYYAMRDSMARNRVPYFVYAFLNHPGVKERFGIQEGDQLTVFQRRLSMTSVAWMAAFGILLIDTAWNPASLSNLSADPFVGTVRNGQRRLAQAHVIAAVKERAGHDVHAGLLELTRDDVSFVEKFGLDATVLLDASAREGVSSLDAIYLVQRMTAPLRAGRPPTSPLWLCARWSTNQTSAPPYSTYSQYWLEFLGRHARDPVIGGLPIRLAMLRKTRLEIDASSGPGGLATALLRGQHLPRVSARHYLKGAWISHLHMEAIRVFQNALEALMARDIEGIERSLQVTRAEFASRLSFALESGLGSLDSTSPACGSAASVDVIRFVPRPADIMKLHILDLSLTANGEQLARSNRVRWEQHWYPIWLRTRAVLASLDSSPHARTSRILRERANNEL